MVCFAIVAGCASAPAPAPVEVFTAAPVAEMAPGPVLRARIVEPNAADLQVADPTAVEPNGDQPMIEAPAPTAAVAFARSDAFDHRFRTADGKRVQVSFSVSYSAAVEDQAAAARNVRNNWDAAGATMRAILEAADLFEEQGRADCEQRLCERLTTLLFPASTDSGHAAVERIIWERLTWQ